MTAHIRFQPEARKDAITLADLADQPHRWVAWREEEIERKKDGSTYLTKIPYDPHTGQRARVPTHPSTWGTRKQAERRWDRLRRSDDERGGVGIVLGELDDGKLLMGIDLDDCFKSNGDILPWAAEVLDRIDSYAEVSPSGKGIKSFFLVAADDIDSVKRLFGTNPDGTPKTRKPFVAGKHREMAIDRVRFYAVTGDRFNHSPKTLRIVAREDVRWFIEEAGPNFLDRYDKSKPTAGVSQGRDQSGSGHGFRFMRERKAAGDSYEQACNAIVADRGEAGEWARRTDERQLQRAWERAPGYRKDEAEEQLDVVRVSDVPMKRVDWVWPKVLARGKVTIISGEPGVGKSQIACFATAKVTRKRKADATPSPSGSVIILAAEDAVDDTVRPRLEAAKADTDRVRVIKAVTSKDPNNPKRRTFDLQRDLGRLEKLIGEIEDAVILVIVDPVSSYMGQGIDGNSMTSVRPILESVGDMAERTGVAVLLIHHPPKQAAGRKALNAFSGSMAFVAAPRVSFIAVQEADSERRLLLAVKNTLGPLRDGVGYYLTECEVEVDGERKPIKTSRVEWDDEPVSVTANEALRGGAEQHVSKLEQAQELLREQLAQGPVNKEDLLDMAKVAGISERTLREAKEALGVQSQRIGFQGGSEWYLTRNDAARGR